VAGGGGGRSVRVSSSVATSEILDIPVWCSVRYPGLSDRLLSEMDETPTRVVLTYRDYEALPADGRRYELHDGELLVTAAPGLPHQRLVGELFVLLRQHVRARRLGEVYDGRPARSRIPRVRAVIDREPARHRGGADARYRDRVALDGPRRSWRQDSALRPPRDHALLDR